MASKAMQRAQQARNREAERQSAVTPQGRLESSASGLHWQSTVELKDTKRSLVSAITALRDSLNNELQRFAECPEYLPNSLGMVQGRGQEVDRLCSEYAVRVRTAKGASNLLDALAKVNVDVAHVLAIELSYQF